MSLTNGWSESVITYAEAINNFVDSGLKDGWDNVGEEPEELNVDHLVSDFIKEIKNTNSNENRDSIRDKYSLTHSPLIAILKEQGQSIPEVALLDNGKVVARILSPYDKDGYVVEIDGVSIKKVEEIKYFGQSPNKEYFAYPKENGVSITKGWLGEEVNFCNYPKGDEGVPSHLNIEPFDSSVLPTKLIPFPDGKRVLYITSDGIFVLTSDRVERLLPTKETITYLNKDMKDDETADTYLTMEHGSISLDGSMIAVGSQDSTHIIYDKDLNIIADVGNLMDYPHYAFFSNDNEMVAFNSCHFYNGVTIAVPTNLLPNLKTEAYEEYDSLPILEGGARVYAGVYRKDEFIIGDAHGYIRAFGKDGKLHWQHFIGSTIGAIDISKDESMLVCTTCAGFISIIELDKNNSEPYEIGTGGHHELKRWIFWKDETPMVW